MDIHYRRQSCIYMTSTSARLLLDPGSSERYAEEYEARDRAAIVHEYVHSQEPLNRGMVGLALEELRAEYFSGGINGYLDVKRHFSLIRLVDGIDVTAIFEQFGESKTIQCIRFLLRAREAVWSFRSVEVSPVDSQIISRSTGSGGQHESGRRHHEQNRSSSRGR